jgi:hypothetical protein
MADQHNTHEDEGAAPDEPPVLKGVEVLPSLESKPATEADLKKVQNEMSGFERSTIRWTRASFVIVLATALFIGLQWLEMRSGGGDTHTLAESAKKQADKSETISDSIGKAVTALDASNKQAKDALDQTIKENRKALAATLAQNRRALDASIAASRADERAYVTIGKPDGTVAEIIWPKDEKGNAGLLVYFQNNGRLPAKFNWGADSNIIEIVPSDPKIVTYDAWKGPPTELPTNHLFQPMYRAKARKGSAVQWSGTIDIAGSSSYQGILWETPKERMLQLIEFDKMFIASGKFEYCDGFGKRVCKHFRINYAREPYNRFFLIMEDSCPAYEMQIAHPAPDMDYLPPCDISERKELQFTIPSLPNP